MAAKRLYMCGCGKWIVRHIPAPQYNGIFSVHQDGSTCSSMHEGLCPTMEDMKAQCKVTQAHYAKLAYRSHLVGLARKLAKHYNVNELYIP